MSFRVISDHSRYKCGVLTRIPRASLTLTDSAITTTITTNICHHTRYTFPILMSVSVIIITISNVNIHSPASPSPSLLRRHHHHHYCSLQHHPTHHIHYQKRTVTRPNTPIPPISFTTTTTLQPQPLTGLITLLLRQILPSKLHGKLPICISLN